MTKQTVVPGQAGFAGVYTALVSPMQDSGFADPSAPIDEAGLSALVESQIQGGVDGLVACGTTGEAAAMTAAEQGRVIRIVLEAARGRVPVLAGVGSPSTAQSLELARASIAAGADGLLAVTPYYNRPPQEGLFLHFSALARLGHPIMLYNVPARTGCDLLPDTVARLCELPAIVALKEASGSVQRTQQLRRRIGDRITLLSGEDALNLPLYTAGARGVVSVVSNVAPALTKAVWRAYEGGELAQAAALHAQFVPLAEALFSEPNPIPAKAALSMLGAAGRGPALTAAARLPLCAMSEQGRARLRSLLIEMELLS